MTGSKKGSKSRIQGSRMGDDDDEVIIDDEGGNKQNIHGDVFEDKEDIFYDGKAGGKLTDKG